MVTVPTTYSGIAFNQVPDSNNKIHSDVMAKSYGFKGGLVPGVTLSAYLVQPAVTAWGTSWLARGHAEIKILAPVYDGNEFLVKVQENKVQENNQGYLAQLFSDSQCCAQATVTLPEEISVAPVRQGHSIISADYCAPPATPTTMQRLQESGCFAQSFHWNTSHQMARYFSNDGDMPSLLNTVTGESYANLSFLLGCANRHFAAVASMSPWVHLQTRSQQYQSLPIDTNLISEMKILNLFEKKGHHFADCEFNLFEQNSDICVCTIWQRAIYLMRGQ